MAEERLPLQELADKHFDVVLVGTGLCECLVAAAAAQVGKQVIHMDGNEHYGAEWATMSVTDLLDAAGNEDHEVEAKGVSQAPVVEEERIALVKSNPDIKNFASGWAHKQAEGAIGAHALNARVLIDRCPRVLLCRGDMVDTMIRTATSHYQQFQVVDKLLVWIERGADSGFVEVPCSKGDVFSSSALTLLEKRMLMKFLTSIGTASPAPQATRLEDVDAAVPNRDDARQHAENDGDNKANESFAAFLDSQGLSDNLKRLIMYALALAEVDQWCADVGSQWLLTRKEGVRRVESVLQSLGRFGDTPFLYSMYGSGDFAQAFARLAAVFGAAYLLRYSPKEACVVDGQVVAVTDRYGTRIPTKHVCLGPRVRPAAHDPNANLVLTERWSGITNAPLFAGSAEEGGAAQETTAFMIIPPNSMGNANSIHVLQLSPKTETCPRGFFLVHLSTVREGRLEDKMDWTSIVSELFDTQAVPAPSEAKGEDEGKGEEEEGKGEGEGEEKGEQSASSSPDISMERGNTIPVHRSALLWSCSFTEQASYPVGSQARNNNSEGNSPAGLRLGEFPPVGVVVDDVVKQAREMFAAMFPGEEFLPERQVPVDGDELDDLQTPVEFVVCHDLLGSVGFARK